MKNRKGLWLLSCLAFTMPSQADEPEVESSGSVQDLLDSIPEIENMKSDKPVPKPMEVTFPAYVRECRAHVLAHFSPSSKLVKKNPRIVTELLVRVDPDGTVTAVTAIQLSGKKSFDRAAIAAINASGDFPPPPPGLRKPAAEGVIIAFEAKTFNR